MEMSYTRAKDRPRQENESGGQVDLKSLLGTWINTNRNTQGITKFILAEKDDQFTMRAFAVDAPMDWGEVEIKGYAADIVSQKPVAFHAIYDFEFMESFLAANTNKGLIIIAAYNRFKEQGKRSNYFSREFYFREI